MGQRRAAQQLRREAILRAAAEVFAARGYQGTTVEEIARRAGVAKGTPYLHFADKADLFYAVFALWTAESIAGADAALAAARTSSARLQALAQSALDYMDTQRQWFPLTLEVWAASGNPALRERFAAALRHLYEGYRQQAVAIIRQGQADGELRADLDAEALAALLTGAVDGLFVQCWFEPGLDAGQAMRGFFEALMRGLLAPARKGRR